MIEVSHQGAVVVAKCCERISDEFIEEIEQALDGCFSEGMPMAVLDLQNTQLISSEGLEYLLDTGDKFRARGGSFKLSSPTDLCAEILTITLVDQDVEVFENTNQAVRSFVQ